MSGHSRPRCLLIVGGGIEQARAYELAHEMGLITVGSDMRADAPALELADYRIVASTRDAQETVRAAAEFNERLRIDGVITLANDVPYTVARVAAELGLPGITLESARLASDKLAMKQQFAADGVPIPDFREVRTAADVSTAIKEWGYPVVIKPIDGRGARGVLRILPSIDVEWAFDRARSFSECDRVIAERYIPGLQLSTESMVYRGTCYTASWSERNYEYIDRFAPYIVENGGILPADLSVEEARAVERVVADATASMGIDNGPVKGDIVVEDGQPKVIELAARLSGGYLATDQIPLARGVDLVRQTIKLALGESLDVDELVPQNLCTLAIRYFFPEPGRVVAIEGFDELDRFDWVTKKMLFCQLGDVLEPVTDHTKRAGFVHVRGASRTEAEERVLCAVESVRIRTVPA